MKIPDILNSFRSNGLGNIQVFGHNHSPSVAINNLSWCMCWTNKNQLLEIGLMHFVLWCYSHSYVLRVLREVSFP